MYFHRTTLLLTITNHTAKDYRYHPSTIPVFEIRPKKLPERLGHSAVNA